MRFTLIDHINALIDHVFAALTDLRRLERWLPGGAGVVVEWLDRDGHPTHSAVRTPDRPPRTVGWVERGLDPTSGATAVMIQEVWTPSSLGAWIRGRFFPKRNLQRHQKEILRNLRNILTP